MCCSQTDQEDLSIGYKSILKKSVHHEDTQWLDYLMNFADYAPNNSIETFVESLKELTLLFSIYSPTIAKYFEHAFITTNNT